MVPSDQFIAFIALTPMHQPSGKIVFAWAVEGDFDPARLKSNTFSMEWPEHSGRKQAFPEIDRAVWLPINASMRKILIGQTPLLDELQKKLNLS